MENNKKGNGTAKIILVVVLLIGFTLGGIYVGTLLAEKGDTYITNTSAEKDEKETAENKVAASSGFASLDLENCVNEKNKTYIPMVGDVSEHGIRVYVQADLKSVDVQYNGSLLNEAYGLGWMTVNEYESLGTKTLNKRISQIFIGGYGQAMGNEVILYLMEDGTIQYTPIHKELTGDNWKQADNDKKFISYGELPGVEEVVGLSMANTSAGYATTIARKADGSFYDLSSILRETGNFNS